MTTGRDTSSNRAVNRLASLDLLRLFAAMSVLFYHYLYRGALDGEFLDVSYGATGDWFQFAYLGVNLFFVISGFVIMWSAEQKDWLGFSIARFARLWPAYIMAVSLTAIAILFYATPPFGTGLTHFLTNLTFVAPAFGQPFMDGVYWTIVMEIVFYVWVAIGLMTGILPRHLPQACTVWIAIILANEFWLTSGALRQAALTLYGPWFLTGVLLYRIWSRGITAATVALLTISIAITMQSVITEHHIVAASYGYAHSEATVLLLNTALIGLFIATIAAGRWVRPTPLVIAAGALTYPLYLIHQNVGYMAINTLAPEIGRWPALIATMAAMLMLAWLICRFWEKPAAKVLRQGLCGLAESIGKLRFSPSASQSADNPRTA